MRLIKALGIGLGGLLGIIIIIAGALHLIGKSRLDEAQDVAIAELNVTQNDLDLQRGQHLATIGNCNYCHGTHFEGKDFINESPIGYVPAPNLTSSGPVAEYNDLDWATAIRHGVAKDGRTIVVMPSNHYAVYGDDDLANLIAYLKKVPPVENSIRLRKIEFPGTVIFGILAYDSWPVNQISHSSIGGRNAPTMDATAEYGKYLVQITLCVACHGENLAGQDPKSDAPKGPNITRGGNLGHWTFEEFALATRAGKTPEGKQLDHEEMPWGQYSIMSELEVRAIWTFIQTTEKIPDNH